MAGAETEFTKSLEAILGLCREKLPPRFYRTFEDRPFDTCDICRQSVLAGGYYTIVKYYAASELRAELALCHNCQSALKQRYSDESQAALKQIYGEAYRAQRLQLLARVQDDVDRVSAMLSRCSLCDTAAERVAEHIEYALCQGDELVLYTHPSLVCGPCALRVDAALSARTREEKRRFFHEYFGFSPPGSGALQPLERQADLWRLL